MSCSSKHALNHRFIRVFMTPIIAQLRAITVFGKLESRLLHEILFCLNKHLPSVSTVPGTRFQDEPDGPGSQELLEFPFSSCSPIKWEPGHVVWPAGNLFATVTSGRRGRPPLRAISAPPGLSLRYCLRFSLILVDSGLLPYCF